MAIKARRSRRARVRRKNYRIDVTKLERTKRVLGTRTETETIHRALDLVADEAALVAALRDFVLKGGGRGRRLQSCRRGRPGKGAGATA
jgi:hypothetical protein